MASLALTDDQRSAVARIVSDKYGYVDIRAFGASQFDDEEWRELAQEFADAIEDVLDL